MEAGKPGRKIIQEEDDIREMFVVKVVFSGSILDVYFNRLKKNVMAWMYGIQEREELKMTPGFGA